jgi:endogenous inhibitor of DNA gyrase (YacG/DUF329 family)
MIRPQTCPICDRELAFNAAQDSPLFPFCSRRCKQVDLFRWTEGHYAIVETLTPEKLVEELGDLDPDAPDSGREP